MASKQASRLNRLPDEVLRKFAQDLGFRKLTPEAQDRIVERIAQERFNKVPKYPNVLTRAARAIMDATTGIPSPFGMPHQITESLKSEFVSKPISEKTGIPEPDCF